MAKTPAAVFCNRNHGALRPQKPLRLITTLGMGKLGRLGKLHLTPTHYTVTTRMIHFNVSLIVSAKSQDSVHKTTIFEKKGGPKRIEPRSFCLPVERRTSRLHRFTYQNCMTLDHLWATTQRRSCTAARHFGADPWQSTTCNQCFLLVTVLVKL